MGALNLQHLVRGLSADEPCGPAVESDAASYARFLELEKAAQPAASRWNGVRDIPGKPPEWSDVERRSLELFSGGDDFPASRDLRVAVLLARARLQTAGHAGFAEALGLIVELLESFWESVHPQLLSENGAADAIERESALATLGGEVVNEVRRAPLLLVPGVGGVSWRDIEQAKSVAAPATSSDARVLTAAQIDGVFTECKTKDPMKEQVLASYRGVCAARDHAQAIRSILDAHGCDGAPVAALSAACGTIAAFLKGQLVGLGLAGDVGGSAEDLAQMLEPTASSVASSASHVLRQGEIASRDDVRAALQGICDYYDRVEPASPLPILLKRAMRLVDKSFIDIIRDLAPGGLAQVEQLRGADPETQQKK